VDLQELRGETPLHLAAYYGHVAVAELLINHGAEPRMGNKDRKTPLELARREGHRDIVRLLQAHVRD
jgi:ankyrin repeat protein